MVQLIAHKMHPEKSLHGLSHYCCNDTFRLATMTDASSTTAYPQVPDIEKGVNDLKYAGNTSTLFHVTDVAINQAVQSASSRRPPFIALSVAAVAVGAAFIAATLYVAADSVEDRAELGFACIGGTTVSQTL